MLKENSKLEFARTKKLEEGFTMNFDFTVQDFHVTNQGLILLDSKGNVKIYEKTEFSDENGEN